MPIVSYRPAEKASLPGYNTVPVWWSKDVFRDYPKPRLRLLHKRFSVVPAPGSGSEIDVYSTSLALSTQFPQASLLIRALPLGLQRAPVAINRSRPSGIFRDVEERPFCPSQWHGNYLTILIDLRTICEEVESIIHSLDANNYTIQLIKQRNYYHEFSFFNYSARKIVIDEQQIFLRVMLLPLSPSVHDFLRPRKAKSKCKNASFNSRKKKKNTAFFSPANAEALLSSLK